MATLIEQEEYEQPYSKKSTPDLRPFMLRDVEYTSKKLGDGSFGSVEEVMISGTVCACKKLHDALIDPRNQGVGRVNSRFESECRLMSCVRHPKVVQFLGLCEYPASQYPALVMERLACSVEDLLMKAQKENSIIPFSLKISILTDTLKGLVYLHSHDPCIVHRDLTSRNILLTPSMEAKIADFGNALIIDPQTVNKTLTRIPGTAVYMPPEAMAYHSKGYNAKVDVFSFGHLALYIMIQEFPEKLLQATYTVTDKDKEDQLLARSELKRRQPYIEILYQAIGKEHLISMLIRQCLSNSPERRPTAKNLLKQILDAPECMLRDERDVYREFSSMHKLELIQLMQNCKTEPVKGKNTKVDVIHALPSVATPAPTMSKRSSGDHQWSLTDQLKSGVPGRLEITTTKSGSKFSKKSLSKKQYTFQILDGTLRYYEEKMKGDIKLDDVVDVTVQESKNPHIFPFELVCDGKEQTSIRLGALSEEERTSWVEAIRNKGVDVIEEYDIVCVHNEAYQTTRGDHTTEREYSAVAPKSSTGTSVALNPPVVNEASKKEEVLYDVIDYDKCIPTTKAAGTQNRNGDVKTENVPPYLQVVASSTSQQESHDTSNGTSYEPYTDYIAMDNTTEDVTPSSANADYNGAATNADTATHGIDKQFSTSQLYNMLEELLHTINSKHGSEFQNRHSGRSVSDGYYANGAANSSEAIILPGRSLSESDTQNHQTPPPLPPKPQNMSKRRETNNKQQSSVSSSPERPATLAIGLNDTAKLGRTNTYPNFEGTLYVNDISETSSEGVDAGGEVTRGIPSLVIEQPTDDGILRERKKSSTKDHKAGFLDPMVLKMALNQKLKTKDHSPQSPLLVTGDGDPELLEDRPDWAIPSTDVSPLPSPQISLDTRNPLSLLQQQASNLFLQSTALCDLQEIGKGQFGKVYKATMKRSEHSPGVIVAVKEIKEYKSEQETSDFQHEMSVMKDMIHPNIIHLYGMIKEGPPRLVLEYLPKGDLKHHLTRNKRSVNELVKYMIDVAMGMHYIAERGLVHRDLAARNIMVDDNETCKVADFGLLREIPKDDAIYHATRQLPWPIRWMAPESLGERDFSSASDVWSFGVLCWEMYYPTETPYAKFTDNMQCVMKVTKGYRLSIPSAYPSTVGNIMKACWQNKPKNRPSFVLISMLLTNMVVQGHWN